jgi:hypothetical protein
MFYLTRFRNNKISFHFKYLIESLFYLDYNAENVYISINIIINK